ncbi:MAG: hypothetical protein KJ906_02935 [Nanoarchaeota archaeon]|nr:hypothetical protein [Nanoarchaeota archaeon]
MGLGEQYLIELHRQLIREMRFNRYSRLPDRKFINHCDVVAADISKRLLEDDKISQVLEFSKYTDEKLKLITPQLYGGKVQWKLHLVCDCNNLIYDPMLEKPIKIADYSKMVFGEYVPRVVHVSKNDIVKFIETHNSDSNVY